MREYVVAALFFCVLSAEKCQQAPKFAVGITLTQTESYCGGAMPPPELLEDLNTPKPYAGKQVFLFNDALICLDSIEASDTSFKTALSAGHYTLRLVPQLVEIEMLSTEKERCEAAHEQRILSMFEISSDTSLTANLHFACDPCMPPPP